MQLDEGIPTRLPSLTAETLFEQVQHGGRAIRGLLTVSLSTDDGIAEWQARWCDWIAFQQICLDGVLSSEGFITPGDTFMDSDPDRHLRLWWAFMNKVWPFTDPAAARGIEIVGRFARPLH